MLRSPSPASWACWNAARAASTTGAATPASAIFYPVERRAVFGGGLEPEPEFAIPLGDPDPHRKPVEGGEVGGCRGGGIEGGGVLADVVELQVSERSAHPVRPRLGL